MGSSIVPPPKILNQYIWKQAQRFICKIISLRWCWYWDFSTTFGATLVLLVPEFAQDNPPSSHGKSDLVWVTNYMVTLLNTDESLNHKGKKSCICKVSFWPNIAIPSLLQWESIFTTEREGSPLGMGRGSYWGREKFLESSGVRGVCGGGKEK